jgi:stage III sporulation protein SpoIIIAA
MTQLKITDDLQALLGVLPVDIREAVEQADDSENLLEIILDLGRVPTARFVDREIPLRESEVTRAEIDHVDERTGEFDADNRAGIERTLHRISAIRNRRAHIVGLTLRVGRAVYGTVDIGPDLGTTRRCEDHSTAGGRPHSGGVQARGGGGYFERDWRRRRRAASRGR